MAENYKLLYEQMKKVVQMYQDQIVPELRLELEKRVEVVRCKDCVYNENGTCTHSEYFDDTKYRPDYFCADGERRNDEERID